MSASHGYSSLMKEDPMGGHYAGEREIEGERELVRALKEKGGVCKA